MIDKRVYSKIIPKVNHYQVKDGKLIVRPIEQSLENNYRIIPYSSSQYPNREDYYQETIKRLQNQLQKARIQIKQNQETWSSPNIQTSFEQIRKYRQKIRILQTKLKDRQLQLNVKLNELKIKQMEIKEKDLEISIKKQQLLQKDKLIEYQLSVVDRLICQIQQKEREMLQQSNFDIDQFEPICHGSQRASPYRGNLLSLQLGSSFKQNKMELSEFCERIQQVTNEMQCTTPKAETNSTNQVCSTQDLLSHRSDQFYNKDSLINNLQKWRFTSNDKTSFFMDIFLKQANLNDSSQQSFYEGTEIVKKLF